MDRPLFLPPSEAHKAIIARCKIALNADKELCERVETGLRGLLHKTSIDGNAWNDLHESSAQCASNDKDLRTKIDKAEGLKKEISEKLELHRDKVTALLRPVESVAGHDEPLYPLVEAAWKVVLRGRGSLERIQEQNPEWLRGLVDEENARLRKELAKAKATVSIIKDSQAFESTSDGDSAHEIENLTARLEAKEADLVALRTELSNTDMKYKDACQEIENLVTRLRGKDANILALQNDLLEKDNICKAASRLRDFQAGRIKGLRAGNESNLVLIEALREEVECLKGEAANAKEEITRLEQDALLNAPKLEDHEQEYQKYRDTAATLEAIEVALDTMVRRSQSKAEYVRSTEGRLDLLDGLGQAWRRAIKDAASAEALEKELRSEISELEKAKVNEALVKKITDSKLKSALRRCKSLADEMEASQLQNQTDVRGKVESLCRTIGERDTMIGELELQKSQLNLKIHRLGLLATGLRNDFTGQTVLLAEMAKNRIFKARLCDTMATASRAQKSRLDELEVTYSNHIEQAMYYIILCIPWEGLKDCIDLQTFKTLISRLLPIQKLERDSSAEVLERTWIIANPFEVTAIDDIGQVADHRRPFSIAVGLYMLVEAGQHCSRLGFSMVEQLHAKLTVSNDSFGPTVFMITVDLYVSKLHTTEHLRVEEAAFAMTIYQLWRSVDKCWPEIWQQVCPQGRVYNPAIQMIEELQRLDDFVRNVFGIIVDLVPGNESPPDIPIQGRAAAWGHPGQQLITCFPSITYKNRALVTKEESRNVVLIVQGSSYQEVIIVEKAMFSMSQVGASSLGLTFALKGGMHIFRNKDVAKIDEWWRKMIGSYIDTSLAPEEITRRLELLALYQEGKIKL